MSIEGQLLKLDAGVVIELFELDATGIGGSVSRFHSGLNIKRQNVVWQGNTYTAWPIEASGFELTTKGTVPRPVLRAANVSGLIGAMCADFDDLVGAKLIRRRTLLKYLDSVNFDQANPDADPTAHSPDEVWFVDRKSGENKLVVEFELAPPSDIQGVKLPRRLFVKNVCAWRYKGEGCGYAGGAVADEFDVPTTDTNLDKCGKRLVSCELRFGTGVLPFGGFPGVGLVR